MVILFFIGAHPIRLGGTTWCPYRMVQWQAEVLRDLKTDEGKMEYLT
jgi:hypothetical protein